MSKRPNSIPKQFRTATFYVIKAGGSIAGVERLTTGRPGEVGEERAGPPRAANGVSLEDVSLSGFQNRFAQRCRNSDGQEEALRKKVVFS